MTALLLVLLAVSLSAADRALASDAALNGDTLADYLEYAHRQSPTVAAAVARQEVERAGELKAGSLPDPMISYGHYFEEVETRVGPQVNRVGVRQRLPWFGKLSLAEDAARERVSAAGEKVRAERLGVTLSVTMAYADYAYRARAIEITEERLALLQSLYDVVKSEYTSGRASYGNVMKAQVSVARVQDSLESLLDGVPAMSSRLAAAVGMPPSGPLPLPDSIPEPETVDATATPEALAVGNPDLQALTHQVESARFQQQLAGRTFFPDLTIGVDYIETDEASMPVPDSGKDPVIGVASLSIPLWSGKHRGALDQARAALAAAERMKEQRTLQLTAELNMAQFKLDDATRRVALYEDSIVPAAEQSVAATDASYRAGKADFDALISAHEVALESELSLARARADALIAAARLARLIGDDEWGL